MDSEIKNALLAILILNLFGIIAYHFLEGWTWIDSLYFSSATLTTVGYGDIVPKTDMGRLFTILYMWSGVSVGFYTLTLLSRQQGENFRRGIGKFKNLESRVTRIVSGKKAKD
ncbi:MAG: potassium channel family protein [Candidatus Micrarchaeia archaeon]